MIDDHSRLFLASKAFSTIKARMSWTSSMRQPSLHGLPASLLTDNGAVFTATPRKGKVLLQTELERLRDLHEELKALPPPDLREDRATTPNAEALPRHAKSPPGARRTTRPARPFVHYYNTTRPHRALNGRTPLQAYSARMKARPSSRGAPSHPLQGQQRQGRRPRRKSHPAPQQQATPHRHRQSPQRTRNQAPDRRPKHPRHRPTKRRATTRTDARPQPRLPTTRAALNCLPCPETSVSDVPTHQHRWRGQDSNLRPSGYEPDELPDCSTPRRTHVLAKTGPFGRPGQCDPSHGPGPCPPVRPPAPTRNTGHPAADNPTHNPNLRPHLYDPRLMRTAVVDIGTNSTRLLVADVDQTTGAVAGLHRESQVTRLGDRVDAGGELSEEAMGRVFATLSDYRATIDRLECEANLAVLTSAVRDASNGARVHRAGALGVRLGRTGALRR